MRKLTKKQLMILSINEINALEDIDMWPKFNDQWFYGGIPLSKCREMEALIDKHRAKMSYPKQFWEACCGISITIEENESEDLLS